MKIINIPFNQLLFLVMLKVLKFTQVNLILKNQINSVLINLNQKFLKNSI